MPYAASRCLRVVQVDLLRQNTLAVDLGHFRRALQGPADQVGKVVQLPIGIFIPGNRGQARFRICGSRMNAAGQLSG